MEAPKYEPYVPLTDEQRAGMAKADEERRERCARVMAKHRKKEDERKREAMQRTGAKKK